MKWLVLLIALIVVVGCEHSHPVAEHEHIHEHEHEHIHLAEAYSIYRELAGTYQLESTKHEIFTWDDTLNKSVESTVRMPPDVKGELTLTADFKFKMKLDSVDFRLEVLRRFSHRSYGNEKTYKHELDEDEWYYYLVSSPTERHGLFSLFEFPMFSGWGISPGFSYRWDGKILTFITHETMAHEIKPYDDSLVLTANVPETILTMKWRKVGS